MVDYIRIDNKADLHWMQGLIAATLAKPTAEALVYYVNAQNWGNYLANPVSASEVAADVGLNAAPDILIEKDLQKVLPKPKPRGRPPKAGAKAKKKSVAKPKVIEPDDPYSCKDHLHRKGVQVPRDACPKCWAVYKALHPMEYGAKWAAFQRKQNAAT